MDQPFSGAEVVPVFDHEVRNAASIVLSNLEFLQLDETDPSRREALEDAHRAAARIQRLTADLRAVALRAAREPAPLRPIVEAALVRARQAARSAMTIELAGEATATIDAELIGRVLEDVLDAVLHDDRAQALAITIAAGARITLTVAPGIAWPRLSFHRLSVAAQGGALTVEGNALTLALPAEEVR